MKYIIDGHNLIPKLGLRLDSLDDEMMLINRLQAFCRRDRSVMDVYFDGAPPGKATTNKMGAVTAHFITFKSSADTAIERKLSNLGNQARNWTVVSSDHRVQAAGRAVHARICDSVEFAEKMLTTKPSQIPSKPEGILKEAEVREWLNLFRKRKK